MKRQQSKTGLRIGELATELGINPKTIRYYEAIDLLPAPVRTTAGYRLYGAPDRERLRFITKAKAIGFTLHLARDPRDPRPARRWRRAMSACTPS
jgi:DNA-binding transcriptional MerR regulator